MAEKKKRRGGEERRVLRGLRRRTGLRLKGNHSIQPDTCTTGKTMALAFPSLVQVCNKFVPCANPRHDTLPTHSSRFHSAHHLPQPNPPRAPNDEQSLIILRGELVGPSKLAAFEFS